MDNLAGEATCGTKAVVVSSSSSFHSSSFHVTCSRNSGVDSDPLFRALFSLHESETRRGKIRFPSRLLKNSRFWPSVDHKQGVCVCDQQRASVITRPRRLKIPKSRSIERRAGKLQCNYYATRVYKQKTEKRGRSSQWPRPPTWNLPSNCLVFVALATGLVQEAEATRPRGWPKEK